MQTVLPSGLDSGRRRFATVVLLCAVGVGFVGAALLMTLGFGMAESDDYAPLLLALLVIGVFAVAYLWLAIAMQRWAEPWSAWALIAPAFGIGALLAGTDFLVVFIGVGCGGCAFGIAVGARVAARRAAARRVAAGP